MKPANNTIMASIRRTLARVRRIRSLAVCALAVSLASLTFAQARGGARLYDPATEITIQGTVESVTSVEGRRGWSGTHLQLKSGDQKYDIHVGPSAFIAKSGFTFSAGDQVEVVGSKVRLNDADALIARQITKDGKILTLRDKQGIPAWSGGRGRSQ